MVEITEENFQSEVIDAKGIVMVDFWAVWCGPCRALAPYVEQIAKEYEGKAKVCKCDTEVASDLSASLGIMAIPTLLFFKDGELKERLTGLVQKSKIAQVLDSL
ncbi:MAG: thioredoxin [Marinilabiliaceae bacterium]|nr:thioredoxin [Marinilabiliaceae bacterium]